MPALLLISEGSPAPDDQHRTQLIIDELPPGPTEVRLLPPPAFGGLTGNRNHLTSFVETTYLLFLDDDAGIHEHFVRDAVAELRSGHALIVTASYGTKTQHLWFTLRGHWRVARNGEPDAVSYSTVAGPSSLFHVLPSDERIIYGYEEADFTFRLYRLHPEARVMVIDRPSEHRGEGDTVGMTSREKITAMRSSRCLVTINRYWDRRSMLALFLVSEPAHNLLRRRPPFPRGLVDHQWKKAVARAAGIRVSDFRLPSPSWRDRSADNASR